MLSFIKFAIVTMFVCSKTTLTKAIMSCMLHSKHLRSESLNPTELQLIDRRTQCWLPFAILFPLQHLLGLMKYWKWYEIDLHLGCKPLAEPLGTDLVQPCLLVEACDTTSSGTPKVSTPILCPDAKQELHLHQTCSKYYCFAITD